MTKFRTHYLLVCLSTFFVSSSSLALTLANLSATMPRGTANQIELRFEMRTITDADLQSIEASSASLSSIQELVIRKLNICVDPDFNRCRGDGNKKLRFEGQRGPDGIIEEDIDRFHSVTFAPGGGVELSRDPRVDRRYNARIHLLIRPLDAQRCYDTDTTIRLHYHGQQEELSVNPGLSTAVISRAQGVATLPTNRGILVRWQNQNAVHFLDETIAAPSGMRVYLIPASLTDLGNIMSDYQTDPSTEELLYRCWLDSNIEEKTCRFSCDNGSNAAYLSLAAIQEQHPEIQVREVSFENTAHFSSLENLDENYAIITQYLPSGLRPGDDESCHLESPIQSYSFVQLTGGGEPTEEDPSCFIATAAFGTPFAAELTELRWFRDKVLLNVAAGRSFVEWYYQVSPAVAEHIASKPQLAKLVRTGLYGPVILIRTARSQPFSLLIGLMSLSLFACLLMFRESSALKKR